jgi:chromosome segregation ATPase
VIFAVLVIAHNVRKPVELIAKEATEIIHKFVNLQDQRNELNQELEKRDEQLLQGVISRREYQRRRRFIEKRLNELNRTLSPVKKELSKTSSRYADMIRQIEKAESELEAFRASKFQVRNQYRSGRIVKDAYHSIISDMDKRASKAQETLYSLLITLREEAR